MNITEQAAFLASRSGAVGQHFDHCNQMVSCQLQNVGDATHNKVHWLSCVVVQLNDALGADLQSGIVSDDTACSCNLGCLKVSF
jgi:hypothetical protein